MPTSVRPDTPVSATEANRSFSRLLRGVQNGESYVVTSHGRPVARLAPALVEEDPEAEKARRAVAHEALMEHLRNQPPRDPPIGKWSREELYEERLSRWLDDSNK